MSRATALQLMAESSLTTFDVQFLGRIGQSINIMWLFSQDKNNIILLFL